MVSTKLRKDLKRAKEECPVVQILSITSWITHFSFFSSFFWHFLLNLVQNTHVFLIAFVLESWLVFVIQEGKTWVFCHVKSFYFACKIIKMEDDDVYSSWEFCFIVITPWKNLFCFNLSLCTTIGILLSSSFLLRTS
jgi:hypothetical protein